MLKLEGIKTGYYKKEILHNVKLEIKKNFIYLIIGPNGAGKSTFLKTIAGFLKPWEGKLFLEEEDISSLSPSERAKKGIGYFSQGGEVFKDLTVKENLEIAGILLDKGKFEEGISLAYQNFPKLKDFKSRRAGLLSGGERHQLALSMLFVRKPKLILLDEPSAGLSPSLVKEILSIIRKLKDLNSSTIILVEQNVSKGLEIADLVYLMKAGEILSSAKSAKTVKFSSLEKLFFE